MFDQFVVNKKLQSNRQLKVAHEGNCYFVDYEEEPLVHFCTLRASVRGLAEDEIFDSVNAIACKKVDLPMVTT